MGVLTVALDAMAEQFGFTLTQLGFVAGSAFIGFAFGALYTALAAQVASTRIIL